MTLTKAQLVERYINGDTSGKASRMEIRDVNGLRCIVGYGWAVYAADLGEIFVLFGDGYKTDGTNVGWAGYSGTTTGHLQDIKGGFNAFGVPFSVADYRLTVKELEQDSFAAHGTALEYEVEPDERTGRLYQFQ